MFRKKREEQKVDFDLKTLKKANFCMNRCPACKRARKKGKGLVYRLVKIEGKLCPSCRAYEKVYGVPAYENPSDELKKEMKKALKRAKKNVKKDKKALKKQKKALKKEKKNLRKQAVIKALQEIE